MSRLRLFACALALLAAVSQASASLVWRPGEGWSDESGNDISASSSRDMLEKAHKLEAQNQRDDALKAYKALVRKWPLSFFAPEAQYRMGKILEDEGDFVNAFQAFQKMVTKYPSSEYFEQALAEQYRIANLYLAGEPQRIWKIPVGPSMDKTVEMYERVIKNAPYGTYAPQCEFNIGQAREKQRRYTDAIDAYQKVIDNYPGSSVAANAQYQIGYAWMMAASSSDYDQSAARKSIDAYQDFMVRYPDSDKIAQAQENVQKLSHRQTQGAFNVAKFYETQHDPRAAFIYYNEVVREDPNGPQAQEAKKRIQQLRPVVEKMPGGLAPDGTASGVTTQVASGPPAPMPAPDGSATNAPDTASGPPVPAADTNPPEPLPGTAASSGGEQPVSNSAPNESASTMVPDPGTTSESPSAGPLSLAPAAVPSDNAGAPAIPAPAADAATNAAPVPSAAPPAPAPSASGTP